MRNLILVHLNFVSQFLQRIFYNFYIEIAYDTIQTLDCVLNQLFVVNY